MLCITYYNLCCLQLIDVVESNHSGYLEVLLVSCFFFSISDLKSLQGSHTTSIDIIHVHLLPQVQFGHLHFEFVHLEPSFSLSMLDETSKLVIM